MKSGNMKKLGTSWARAAVVVVLTAQAAWAAATTLENIDFMAKSGGQFEIRMDFDSAPPKPQSYSIEKPARIALDFAGVSSKLDRKKYKLAYDNADSVVVVEAGGRTRAVVNLLESTSYQTRVQGNSLFLTVGAAQTHYVKESTDTFAAQTEIGRAPASVEKSFSAAVNGVDFRRGVDGEGILVVDLSDDAVDVDVRLEGSVLKVDLRGMEIPEQYLRNYDVTDFATPVINFEARQLRDGGMLTLKVKDEFDYLAYQADQQYVVSVKPLNDDDRDRKKREFAYAGDSLSLNFQDIPVRAVLQLIADFTDLNLVASDTVDGRITLRLKNVPWDQALDLVLKTKGLDKRLVGDVLMVAPAEEIAERERQELETNKQLEELAPLRTELVKVRYADAAELVTLFGGDRSRNNTSNNNDRQEDSILSERGSIVVDERTNSLLVTETAAKIEELRRLIKLVDIPIRQVMVEARIVKANSDFSEKLGVKWGGAGYSNSGQLRTGGGLDSVAALGASLDSGIGTIDVTYPDALNVDLGVLDDGASKFSIGYADQGILLNLELSALESGGHGEVVSQPKVITGDKQTATISSGVKIPYQTRESGGSSDAGNQQATITLEEAVLKLEVTPKITPDDHIIMDLVITQDALAGLASNDQPLIDTTQLETQVLVNNGETIVLGGVFQTEDIVTEAKTPLLGDLPVVGRLFKRTTNQKSKTETLIFITPSILADVVQ